MKYIKKRIEVEAEQWFPGKEVEGVEEFYDPNPTGRDASYPVVRTLEGPLRVSPGDWIITGIAGEKYPCKPQIFELTYESVCEQAERKMSASEAEALGYTIDRTAAGCWYAYKGTRFSADNEGVIIETEDETRLRERCEELDLEVLEWVRQKTNADAEHDETRLRLKACQELGCAALEGGIKLRERCELLERELEMAKRVRAKFSEQEKRAEAAEAKVAELTRDIEERYSHGKLAKRAEAAEDTLKLLQEVVLTCAPGNPLVEVGELPKWLESFLASSKRTNDEQQALVRFLTRELQGARERLGEEVTIVTTVEQVLATTNAPGFENEKTYAADLKSSPAPAVDFLPTYSLSQGSEPGQSVVPATGEIWTACKMKLYGLPCTLVEGHEGPCIPEGRRP